MRALPLLSQGRTFASAFLPPFAPRCAFSAFLGQWFLLKHRHPPAQNWQTMLLHGSA